MARASAEGVGSMASSGAGNAGIRTSSQDTSDSRRTRSAPVLLPKSDTRTPEGLAVVAGRAF